MYFPTKDELIGDIYLKIAVTQKNGHKDIFLTFKKEDSALLDSLVEFFNEEGFRASVSKIWHNKNESLGLWIKWGRY